MRILTNSWYHNRGLISLTEAHQNAPQTVIFCVPITKNVAAKLTSLEYFGNYFFEGITTKIINNGNTETIYLEYVSLEKYNPDMIHLPKFKAKIKGHEIDFYLSTLNFLNDDFQRLQIDFFYNGRKLYEQLENKSLVILEPNWKQLDKLFLERRGIIYRLGLNSVNMFKLYVLIIQFNTYNFCYMPTKYPSEYLEM